MSLSNIKLASLVSIYNAAVIDYAPEGFEAVTSFKSKAIAADRIEALCKAGSLAITFDGDSAVIVDAMEAASTVNSDDMALSQISDAIDNGADASSEPYTPNAVEGDTIATGTALALYTGDAAEVDGEAEGEADEGDDDAATLGDGKGAIAASGFVRASDDWLKTNERGTEAREAYRKARRKAARMTRKAARSAKEAALDAAIAGN